MFMQILVSQDIVYHTVNFVSFVHQLFTYSMNWILCVLDFHNFDEMDTSFTDVYSFCSLNAETVRIDNKYTLAGNVNC